MELITVKFVPLTIYTNDIIIIIKIINSSSSISSSSTAPGGLWLPSVVKKRKHLNYNVKQADACIDVQYNSTMYFIGCVLMVVTCIYVTLRPPQQWHD
jgi:hypothetical protein